MRRLRVLTAGLCLWLPLATVQAADAPPKLAAQGSIQPAFAPWDNIEGLIIEAIGAAKKQVLVQAYLLTSKKITAALIAAHRRGIAVKVLVDARQLARTASSTAGELAAAGVAVWVESAYQNAHNKVVLVDAATSDAVVITGSYNFTWTAQHRNAENMLIIRHHPPLAARYAMNWERHRQDAAPYKK